LTLLTPDIEDAIRRGGSQGGLQLEEPTRTMPSAWEEQREKLRSLDIEDIVRF
jgi:hypothetical protein